MSTPKNVDSYIANAGTEARPTLEQLRELIKSAVPEAEEGIRYNVPFYTFHGTHVDRWNSSPALLCLDFPQTCHLGDLPSVIPICRSKRRSHRSTR
ncbi:iron chaperone [Halalkalicoccus subterraneus]|uniref:iron chaperone n=1 Tax=Halalkalicoccus subterraneus TaxID=2675002 RepID=UPI000EFBE8B8